MSEFENLEIFTVIPPFKEGGKSIWHKVGQAFRNRDGSLTLRLSSIPVKFDGSLIVRQKKEWDNGGQKQKTSAKRPAPKPEREDWEGNDDADIDDGKIPF